MSGIGIKRGGWETAEGLDKGGGVEGEVDGVLTEEGFYEVNKGSARGGFNDDLPGVAGGGAFVKNRGGGGDLEVF